MERAEPRSRIVNAGNFFNDKEWIAAGPNGKVVVTWTRFSLGPKGAGYNSSPIVSAFSKDYGKTWNRAGLAGVRQRAPVQPGLAGPVRP